jgi:hypothetical protein
MNKSLLILALGVILFSTIPSREALAGPWDRLSPEEQRVLQPFKEQWDRLPAERQERLRRGVERWQRMNPEQRKEAEEASSAAAAFPRTRSSANDIMTSGTFPPRSGKGSERVQVVHDLPPAAREPPRAMAKIVPPRERRDGRSI